MTADTREIDNSCMGLKRGDACRSSKEYSQYSICI